jgi:hypothetical protein
LVPLKIVLYNLLPRIIQNVPARPLPFQTITVGKLTTVKKIQFMSLEIETQRISLHDLKATALPVV